MAIRYLWLIALSALLLVAAEPSAVSAAGCYSRDVWLYTMKPAAIRDAPNANGAVVRETLRGEAVLIKNSRRSNGSCWLQTQQGWLIYDPMVTSDIWVRADKEVTVAGKPPCLKGERATIVAPMNIRKAPTASSPVVAVAKAGDNFDVIQKTVGEEWCWLKISLGWLAATDRVTRTNKFVATQSTAPTTAPSDIDNCCFVDRQCRTEQEWIDGYWAYQNRQCGAPTQFYGINLSRPRIGGSEAFVNLVNESLNLVERKAPTIYQYIVSVTSVIEEHGPDESACGLAYVGTGRTSLGTCAKDGEMPEALYGIAAVLAHEACHHHGDDMLTGEFDHEPCYQAGHDAYDVLKA